MKLTTTLSWVGRVTPLRIAFMTAVFFAGLHFVIESEFFEYGPLSKKSFVHLLDLKALDLKFQSRVMDDLPDPQVVVAAIDELGVERYGLWPWPRSVIGEFITSATKGGAKAIAFDAVFSDEDRNASWVTIKQFLDDYEAAGLTPGSELAEQVSTGLMDAGKQHKTALATLAALEKRIKALPARKGKGDDRRPLAKSLAETRRALEAASRTFAQSQAGLAESQARNGAYHEALKRAAASISPDEALAEAIGNSPQTILGFFNFYNDAEIVGIREEERLKRLKSLEPAAVRTIYERHEQDTPHGVLEILRPAPGVKVADMQIRPIVAAQAPLKKFADRARAFGYFNVSPDPDGPMRRIRLFNRYEDKLLPSLTLTSAAMYFDGTISPLNGVIKPGVTLSSVALTPEVEIPCDLHGRLMINYYKDPVDYFPTRSVAEFNDGTVPPELYKDKVVLFGMTAQGLFDLRPTPFSPTTPGVYIHASAIQNVIDGRFLERYYGIALIEIVFYLLLGLLMGLVLPKLPAWGGLLVTLGFAVGLYVVDLLFVFRHGTWIMNVLPMLQAGVTFVGVSVYGYLTEGKEKRKIRKAFQFYLTKSVVDEMLKDASKLRLGGEKRVCTVLFSDIRGFTTISEKLSPEDLVLLLNEYLTPMTNLVFQYDGTLDKYMGDAIMAIFGAPVAHPNHASRGCYVALEMMEELRRLQEGWRQRGVPELDIGIGLNTGAMSVGNMGSEVRFDYTVMGDNVNLGSRLEGINKQYGTNIIVSEYTYEAARKDVVCRELDSVRVKGKREPVRIYELMGKSNVEKQMQPIVQSFESGIAAYKAQKWDEAIALFDKIRTELKPSDFASTMYIERCEAMRAEPPGEDWDGVFTMKTK